LRQLADLVAEDGLVTDKDTVGVAASGEDGTLSSGFEGSYLVEEIFCEEEELFEGDVFAEGYEMHLVVVTVEGAIGIDERGAVVRDVSGSGGRAWLETRVADDDGCLCGTGQG